MSVGAEPDRLVAFVDVYEGPNMTQYKIVKDIPMMIASAEEFDEFT